MIDHLSDINMVLTEHARRYLLAEGLPGDRIFNIGSHMAEVLVAFWRQNRRVAEYWIGSVSSPNASSSVSAHREENVDLPEQVGALLDALNRLAEEFAFPVIVSTHPRTKQRLATHALGELSPSFAFFRLSDSPTMSGCSAPHTAVLSDSGTITEEASLLDLPAVTMRDAHERPEGMDAGTLVMARLNAEELIAAIRIVRDGHRTGSRFSGAVPDYQGGEVSTKVLHIVASYIDFVNRVVWSKPEARHSEAVLRPPPCCILSRQDTSWPFRILARCEEHRYARRHLRDTGMRSADLLAMPCDPNIVAVDAFDRDECAFATQTKVDRETKDGASRYYNTVRGPL